MREKKKRRCVPGWIEKPSAKQLNQNSGWAGELNEMFVDKAMQYCIQIRPVQVNDMVVEHAAIRNLDSTDIPWIEKQRIKNEIFGPERLAVEVFPAESHLVNAANMYHLWVYPEGYSLGFGIHDKD